MKLKSESKTIGVYSLISGILMIIMLLSAGNFSLCIGSTFIFAIAYTGMRGLYFAVPAEVGIPVHLTGVTTGIMSLIGYLPDVFLQNWPADGWISMDWQVTIISGTGALPVR